MKPAKLAPRSFKFVDLVVIARNIVELRDMFGMPTANAS